MELHVFAMNEQHQYEERKMKLQIIMEEANHQLVDLEQKYEEMKHKLKGYEYSPLGINGSRKCNTCPK